MYLVHQKWYRSNLTFLLIDSFHKRGATWTEGQERNQQANSKDLFHIDILLWCKLKLSNVMTKLDYDKSQFSNVFV
jgi:hypothetical protein